jgi:hypothetical protein
MRRNDCPRWTGIGRLREVDGIGPVRAASILAAQANRRRFEKSLRLLIINGQSFVAILFDISFRLQHLQNEAKMLTELSLLAA